MTYVLPTVSEVGATDGITSYDCGPSETVIHVLTTVTGGQAAATSNPAGMSLILALQARSSLSYRFLGGRCTCFCHHHTGRLSTSSAGSFPSETGQASTSTQSTPNSGSSNSGSDTSGSSSSSGHLSTGAYVGIAIGGIVGLVILGLILWGCFVCIRKYCFRTPRPVGGSSYAATNYEMSRVAEWQESQSH
jgi:hypothetical protein